MDDDDHGLESPPRRLLERLGQVAGYSWNETRPLFHSSYDFWHVFGTRHVLASTPPLSSPFYESSASSATRVPVARQPLPETPNANLFDGQSLETPWTAAMMTTTAAAASASASASTPPPQQPPTPTLSLPSTDSSAVWEQPVVARISSQPVREERAFQVAKSIVADADPRGDHIIKPLDLFRLSPAHGDHGALIVAIYADPGPNLLYHRMDFGPAFYLATREADGSYIPRPDKYLHQRDPPIILEDFLDFAIGAAHCLEILHHGQGIVHGEIRGDAFHYNVEENKVRIVCFGSGLRSFEHGLTSAGWSALSKEVGAINKLLYISPEQTGRMPTEPDSRTDIYSLGVLFWTLLTQQSVYSGETPLDVVQGVLGRRIPSLSTVRKDIPDVIGQVIQKCTAKNIADRYHSATGLRRDLARIKQILADGDSSALEEMKIGANDVSSFFLLPNLMLGRESERQEIIRLLDRVAGSHSLHRRKGNGIVAGHFSDRSSLANEYVGDDTSSEGLSSSDGTNRRSGSFTHMGLSDHRHPRPALPSLLLSDARALSNETASSHSATHARLTRLWDRLPPASIETASAADSLGLDSPRLSLADSPLPSLSRQLGAAKFRRRGQCEVVLVEGAGGLGKSALIQSVLPDARRHGYCASAKFDSTTRAAFGPVLNLLSSLFKQVWGERNTETAFHQGLKQYVRPVWPMLHKALGLPEFLLGPPDPGAPRSVTSAAPPAPAATPFRSNGRPPDARRREPSPGPGSSTAPTTAPAPAPASTQNSSPSSQTPQDYLASGASTKTTRLMYTCLDILRVFTSHKFISFFLDDIHFADDESLELITQMIGARLNMVIVMTYRPEELSRERVDSIVGPLETDDNSRKRRPTVTRITLSPLKEDDVLRYVSTTLARPQDEVVPLALVIQSKAAGNPFYMREMLSAAYRKKCIFYDYRDSRWHYNLDRFATLFRCDGQSEVLDTDFVTQRLNELPRAARELLAWGALFGGSFSFELVSRLMRGEFSYEEESDEDEEGRCPGPGRRALSEAEVICGLQAAIQAHVIVPGTTDDCFRFAHDRYIHASAKLKECRARRMHYAIAKTLLKYYGTEPGKMAIAALHICEAVPLIKRRVPVRRPFREVLVDCARAAAENGARPTAAKYYKAALDLLQEKAWDEEAEDVNHEETMQLHLFAAESYLYMGNFPLAADLLSVVLAEAKTTADKAPAYVLMARALFYDGKSHESYWCLKGCLEALGAPLDSEPTYEKCDRRFEELSALVRSPDGMAPAWTEAPPADALGVSIGAVLIEAIEAAWWFDALEFYQVVLALLDIHLSRGSFPLSGIAFLHLGVVALSRFNMTQFAVEMGSVGMDMLYQTGDAYAVARGHMVHCFFLGHVHYSMSLAIPQMDDATEMVSVGGDRLATILSYSVCAQSRFLASENCADVEAYCQYGCDEMINWYPDTRGGSLLVAIRQACRALQGKTEVQDAARVLSDEEHDGPAYKRWLRDMGRDGASRPMVLYEALEMAVLFLFGHHDAAVEVGRRCLADMDTLWSARESRLILLFHGLSRTGQLLRQMQDPRAQKEDFAAESKEVAEELKRFTKMMRDWSVVTDVNYRCWTRLLEAQIAELAQDHGQAVYHYEEALDHAAEHNFIMEEALGNYLMAGFFIRRKARRSARAALQDAVGLFRQMAATGVARAIEETHSLLLHGPTRHHRTAETGVQTDFVGYRPADPFRPGGGGVGVGGDEGDELTGISSDKAMTELRGDLIGSWRGSMSLADGKEGAAGLPALDMIDLHAILVSSQVISSVLQVDELLKTMCDVVLQTCGGSATLAAIVVQEAEPRTWCVAASGDPERGASAHNPGLALSGTSLIAENVVLYCTRFLESVLLPDLLADERFGGVNEAWLQRNPLGKAIIAIPIRHGAKPLLGVLYLEGEPGSFTDRNVTVLQLLVNQIGISYSNALSMKSVEKISTENRSMVSVQKRALAKAREAEAKAKKAEAEAKRNVKLAEEAAKAKSIFLANVSHELRTPLNGVIGNSELLRESSLNREQLEMADSIRVSADLLLTVINDILDFSKMEADKMKLYIIAFNPAEMVREVVRAVSYSNREKTSTKNVVIVEDIKLPPMLIYGDPIRLHQVLGNLIGNSLKFTEDGSVTIGARLESSTQETATLTFWVRDTGIGIPPQQLAKLFQPFSQADASTARKYGGSGLGLSICKSLIETMMKGKIRLESEETVGTTAWFTVSFERAKSDVSAGDAQSKSSPPIDRYSAPTTALERAASPNPYLDLSRVPKEEVRICVAEDNPINQKIAIQYAQRLGYPNVSAYDNGLKAVEGLRRAAEEGRPYHIVLMDVQMPVLDGYEATKLIRRDGAEAVRKVLVIAMTASAIQGDREKCLAAGMNDYLAKPVRSEVLKKKLDAYVQTPHPRWGLFEPPSPLELTGTGHHTNGGETGGAEPGTMA